MKVGQEGRKKKDKSAIGRNNSFRLREEKKKAKKKKVRKEGRVDEEDEV